MFKSSRTTVVAYGQRCLPEGIFANDCQFLEYPLKLAHISDRQASFIPALYVADFAEEGPSTRGDQEGYFLLRLVG